MTEENAAVVAAESLGHDVLQGIVDEFRQLPGFANLTEGQQQVHIARLDNRVRKLIAQALRIVFAAQYPACVGEIGPVTFGKSIRFRLDIDKNAESRHELADRTGQQVVLVMANPDEYFARMTEVKARADQHDLFHDSSQPLGHMGVDTPPDKPGTGDFFETGEALDDALPADAGAAPLAFDTSVLEQAGLSAPNGWPIDWSAEQVEAAFIWAYAAIQAREAERDAPEVPEFLRIYVPAAAGEVPDDGLEGAPIPETGPAETQDPESAASLGGLVPQQAPEPVPAPDDLVGIVAALRGRGHRISMKEVKRWSGSQCVAAVSYLASKTRERPEFIPAPPSNGEAPKHA